ncbi:MAG: hypothetical protein HFE63_03700 [Clostridiales bacterium]|nr:hypothetical protein [Clostridiales bacterium]
MKKRIPALILAMLMLAGMVVSCGDNPGGGLSEKDSLTDSDPDTTPPETTGPIASYLPDTDLEGFTLRFATYTNDNGKFVYSEEANGEVVNDAVYNSTRLVTEKYNADIELMFYGADSGKAKDFIRRSVQAGDDEFDIVNGHDGNMFSLTLENAFVDIRSLPYQDFSQPWWPKYSNDEYEINGKQYIFSSFLSYQSLAMSKVIVMNKSIIEDLGLELPYDAVRDGKWTLDMMISMSKQGYRDLNGDNVQDENDQYGFLGYQKLYGFQASFVNCYTEDSNGVVSLSYDREKMVDVVEKMNKLLNGGDGGYIVGTEPNREMFINGKGMFYYDEMNVLTTELMRSSDIDYGVLPLPKYDEDQENYITPAFDAQFGIPVTAMNTDKISFMIEALGSAGYNTVIDAYFETALSTKYSRDDDTIEMLHIIRDTLLVDLAYLNSDPGVSGLGRAFMYFFSNPNAGIISYLDSIEKAELVKVDKVNKAYGD